MAFKYIASQHKAIIFSEAETHADMARRMFADIREVSGAGFGNVGISEDGDIQVSIYGESVSLKIKSDPRDLMNVKFALGLDY